MLWWNHFLTRLQETKWKYLEVWTVERKLETFLVNFSLFSWHLRWCRTVSILNLSYLLWRFSWPRSRGWRNIWREEEGRIFSSFIFPISLNLASRLARAPTFPPSYAHFLPTTHFLHALRLAYLFVSSIVCLFNLKAKWKVISQM